MRERWEAVQEDDEGLCPEQIGTNTEAGDRVRHREHVGDMSSVYLRVVSRGGALSGYVHHSSVADEGLQGGVAAAAGCEMDAVCADDRGARADVDCMGKLEVVQGGEQKGRRFWELSHM